LTEVGLREGLLQELAMHNLEDVQTDLKRLQLALEALPWTLTQSSGDITTRAVAIKRAR